MTMHGTRSAAAAVWAATLAAAFGAGCAGYAQNTSEGAAPSAGTSDDDADGARWIAYGNIGAGGADNARRIGVYDSRDACLAAVEEWERRQVAGALVWGECLPEETAPPS